MGKTSSLMQRRMERGTLLLLALLPSCLLSFLPVAWADGTAAGPFEGSAVSTPQGRIDELVFGRLKQLGIQPAHLCSDAVFVRRVYLDVIGTLPTAQEAQDVPGGPGPEQTPRPDRPPAGAGGVRRLLGDEVERPAAGQGGVPHQPLAQRGAGLSPLDPHVASRRTCPTTGSSARCSPPAAAISACRQVNFYRAVQSQRAAGHRPGRGPDVHGRRGPRSGRRTGWPAWRPSSPRSATSRPRNGRKRSSSSTRTKAAEARSRSRRRSFPTARRPSCSPDQDPREVFADWLIDAEESLVRPQHRQPHLVLAAGARHHPRAGRHPARQPAEQSRAAGLPGAGTGRGPLRPEARLPADPELADVPAFLDSRGPTTPKAAANFAYYPLRRLEAEVLIDALCQITGTTEKYSSADSRAVHLHPRGPALDRPARRQHHQLVPGDVRPPAARHGPGVGAQQSPHGRPAAAPAEFEPHPAQDRAEPASSQLVLQAKGKPREVVDELYLTILSRFPTEEELKIVGAYFQSGSGERTRGRRGPGLGADQQRGVPLPALRRRSCRSRTQTISERARTLDLTQRNGMASTCEHADLPARGAAPRRLLGAAGLLLADG